MLKIEYQNKELGGAKVTVDRRLMADANGKLVEADDPAAVALYASEGKRVLKADFEARGGVLKSALVVEDDPAKQAPPAEPAPKPKAKAKKATKKTTKKKRG